MAHVDRIAARLPAVYAEGELVRGLLGHIGLAGEIVDEDMLEVRRAHFFDQVLERDEAVRLAALLDLAPEDWQDLGAFRAWVHALRNATLEHGAVGVRALQVFAEEYLSGLTTAARIPRLLAAVPRRAEDWGTDPGATDRAAFVENPPRLATAALGPLAPLSRFTLRNSGLDPAPLGLLLSGLPAGPEHVPVIVNLTTGAARAYLGTVRTGERLWLDTAGRARLERRDVTGDLRGIAQVTPGEPWTPADARSDPGPFLLERGDNDLWFLTVAHYGSPGLDRVLLALADLDLAQGAYDSARLDHALFAQEPAVRVTAAWRETTPAAVRVTLPGGLLLTRGPAEPALAVRDGAAASLGTGLDRLSAAGVEADAELAPFRETQPQQAHLTSIGPLVIREGGPTGADRMPDAGGLFDVTPFEDSTFR